MLRGMVFRPAGLFLLPLIWLWLAGCSAGAGKSLFQKETDRTRAGEADYLSRGQAAVPRLATALREGSPKERRAALRAIPVLGSLAVSLAPRVLTLYEKEETRSDATRALASLGPGISGHISTWLNPCEGRRCLDGLEIVSAWYRPERDSGLNRRLLALLDHRREEVRRATALVLLRAGHPTVFRRVHQWGGRPDPREREFACRVPGRLVSFGHMAGNWEPLLRSCLVDTEPEVRRAGVISVERLGLTDEAWELRLRRVARKSDRSLRRRTGQALDWLAGARDCQRQLGEAKTGEERKAALACMAGRPVASHLPWLRRQLKAAGELAYQREVIATIGAMGPAGMSLTTELVDLANREKRLRLACLRSLGRLIRGHQTHPREGEIRQFFLAALGAPKAATRLGALEALRNSGLRDWEFRERLRQLEYDENPRVRERARQLARQLTADSEGDR